VLVDDSIGRWDDEQKIVEHYQGGRREGNSYADNSAAHCSSLLLWNRYPDQAGTDRVHQVCRRNPKIIGAIRWYLSLEACCAQVEDNKNYFGVLQPDNYPTELIRPLMKSRKPFCEGTGIAILMLVLLRQNAPVLCGL